MEKKTLSNLMEGKIFYVPDYQRGYAWEEKQWKDFVQDIDALIDEDIISHYTGTIVIYQSIDKPTENYSTKKLERVDIVDGQQRLTTCSLYLSIILLMLINSGKKDYNAEIPIYLFSGSKNKLQLNNDTADFYHDLIQKGSANIVASTIHQKRLLNAYNYLSEHISCQKDSRTVNFVDYLINLFDAVIRKLNFSFYSIEVESEIGMTFELMNSRGKGLTSLELLKNYLMYWVYRNVNNDSEKEDLTNIINKSWKEVYTNVANCNGSENQCLRIVWTLYQNYTPKKWNGYDGFKSEEVIPLREFSIKSKEETKKYISKISAGLAEISFHYSAILSPQENSDIDGEYEWLSKIKNVGNIANILPLMIAARRKVLCGQIASNEYIELLKVLELYSYRVFLWAGKRSNAGLSQFYKWADDVFSKNETLQTIIELILGAVKLYSNENTFRDEAQEQFYDWYKWPRLLRYTLYEYELYLLKVEGKNAKPKLAWSDLTDSTFEHIFPQTPELNSNWLKEWDVEDIKRYMHDISNIVLTRDNSHYYNFEFKQKKGRAGKGYCYANSDIRQERKISEFGRWDVNSCKERRESIVEWIIKRWGIDKHYETPENIGDVDDDYVDDNI